MDRAVQLPTVSDAIVVIPGVMGSVLRDAATKEIIWGLQDPSRYVDAWLTGRSLARLALTDAEREGRTDRIVPDGPLTFAAWSPVLQGLEPYTQLVHRLGALTAAEAVLPFGYDWRLSIAHNAKALQKEALDHLDRWQRNPAGHPGARLVLVAHSMGGLVARWFTHVLGGAENVRMTITIGTPFHGSIKSAVLLSDGDGAPAPLPKRRLSAMARTMPGIYDLLPFYRCVDEGKSARYLEASDVANFGADADLAAEAMERHDRLQLGSGGGERRIIVGAMQPTLQSITLKSGEIVGHHYETRIQPDESLTRVNRMGDGTVSRGAAAAFGLGAHTVTQTHGALARSTESINQTIDMIIGDDLGPSLGGEVNVGLEVDDFVETGRASIIRISGVAPAHVGITVRDTASGRQVAAPVARSIDGMAIAMMNFVHPGLYRVSATAGGSSAVSQQILVGPSGSAK